MNSQLRTALFAKLNTISLTGGWHYEVADFENEPIYPYGVASVVTSLRKGDTKNYRTEISVQISGYDSNADNLGITGLETIKTQLDQLLGLANVSMTMTDYKLIDVELEFDRGVKQLNDNIFQFVQQYKITIEHN